jgi:predicted patatin/cPLA2 family phospholipase
MPDEPPPTGATPPAPKRGNLALQGGGAHGAFTWGVLDRLLEDPRLEFEGVSGSSAGAINGAVPDAGRARGVSSKFNADWGFLRSLFDRGRAAAGTWLADHVDQVGQAATVDLRERYL